MCYESYVKTTLFECDNNDMTHKDHDLVVAAGGSRTVRTDYAHALHMNEAVIVRVSESDDRLQNA